ncbi:hypothetical protein FHETE_4228 [Fusarium heterosporum]|uniref:Xylanolytic transcriptional activator regulatory domain-containing protein n=1 Tax=Fusarium heterosporum TaxID=42747 RepID=A0A8H5TJI9_FUSHE|nr:hypothetical protein FHETE_4228 [Fusarium heterosporum]
MMGSAKIEKRNRPPKSCEPCRTRKNEKRADKDESVADRLKKLENLIAKVAQETSPREPMASLCITDNRVSSGSGSITSYGPSTSTSSDGIFASPLGNEAPGGLATHIDSNHWYSILKNIRSIRSELPTISSNSQVFASSPATPNSDLRESDNGDFDLGPSEGLSMREILSKLPQRPVCDNMVSLFFRSHYTMMPILHPAKFQQEYESFWESPEETSAIWIALLFALLSLSVGVYEISGKSQHSEALIPSSKSLSKRTQECLLLGNYTTAKGYGVEALLIHLVGCWLRTKVSDTNLWFLMGKVVQLAICKGYHRDPAKVPGSDISPFDAEMRRRAWLSLFQLDALMSFQMGLPSMIPTDCCDTELPRNLNQTDFYPGISELPPSRPFSENTTILYSIVKASVMATFKKVVKHTRSLVPAPYEETISLDSEVRTAYENIPDIFKYKSLFSFIADDVSVIMARTTIELLYLKSIIVLHRHYLTQRLESRFQPSRRSCLEAAEKLLLRQAEMHKVTQPGGQLYDMGWMVTSLTMSDFTLAAMVICLDMTVSMRLNSTTLNTRKDDGELEKNLRIIETAHMIWTTASESSEARTVSHALASTIQRVTDYLSLRLLSESKEACQSSNNEIDAQEYVTIGSAETVGDFDMMDFIDWTLVDNQFQDPTTQEFDLDYWLVDAAGPLDFPGTSQG